MVHVSPGDTFWCKARICSPTESRQDQPFFALLDIGIGEYWFYPSWAHYPPDIDHETLYLPIGVTERWVLSEFTWPDTGSDSFDYIFFYAAILNQEMTSIVGDFGTVQFGYGPPR
jgi:hypothetical protein